MELSKTKKTEAKKLGVSVQYLVLADLISIGYSESDAYSVAYPENEALSMQQNNSIRKNILESSKFKKLLETRKQKVMANASSYSFLGDIELIGTEETAKEILKVAKQMDEGSKERGEMFMKYADLIRKNEQGIEDETDVITFAFPLKCNQCPLLYAYNEFLKKQDEKEVRPVEMERVIRLSHKIIEAAKEAE